MTLQFTLRPSYGHDRYYPVNAAARALMTVVGRRCLEGADLDQLRIGGFKITLTGAASA